MESSIASVMFTKLLRIHRRGRCREETPFEPLSASRVLHTPYIPHIPANLHCVMSKKVLRNLAGDKDINRGPSDKPMNMRVPLLSQWMDDHSCLRSGEES